MQRGKLGLVCIDISITLLMEDTNRADLFSLSEVLEPVWRSFTLLKLRQISITNTHHLVYVER
jgi:hypothetical protein